MCPNGTREFLVQVQCLDGLANLNHHVCSIQTVSMVQTRNHLLGSLLILRHWHC